MAGKSVSPVQRQLRRARRRLLLQMLLDCLAWCWAASLAAAASWLLVQPYLTREADAGLGWGVVGGLSAGATALAVVLAWRRGPRDLDVALAVDDRLNLKERVTTALTLSPQQARSPAGQALLADVNERIAPLRVSARFPLRLKWPAALVPLGAAALALVALFYEPRPGAADGGTDGEQALAEARDPQQKLKERGPARAWPKDRPRDDKLKELDDAWNRLIEQPIDLNNKERVREQVRAVRNLEEKMKERARDLQARVEKNQGLRQQLQKLQGLDPKGAKLERQEGPARNVEEALAKGNLDKAQQELETLRKKLDDQKLNRQEVQQLRGQLQGLRDRLQRLAEQQDRKDALRREADQGNLDPEQLKEALEELAREGEDLQELARTLDECQECLGKGERGKAASKLKALAGKLEEIELTEEELRDLEENAELLEACRLAMTRRLNGSGGDGRPGTRRPMGKEARTESVQARQKAEVDPRGKLRVTGFSRGGTFSKVPARDVQGAFRQAVQDAPEAIDRQRISPEAAEMLKGYYENLGGQKRP